MFTCAQLDFYTFQSFNAQPCCADFCQRPRSPVRVAHDASNVISTCFNPTSAPNTRFSGEQEVV